MRGKWKPASAPGLRSALKFRPRPGPIAEDQLTPIRPALDLAAGADLLRRRPDALPASAPASPAYVEIGARLMPIILETQKVTLAGFRILDPRGVVIAGRDEVGQSLAHIEEVATALQGTIPGGLADSQTRQAAASDLLDQPRRRRPRVLGNACHRQQPRRGRHLYIENAEQHLRPSLSGARQVHPGGTGRRLRDHRHRPGFLPNHHPPDARAGRSRRAHQPRRSRRISAARPLRHARVRPIVAQLPRHGRAIGAAVGLHRDLLGAPHP